MNESPNRNPEVLIAGAGPTGLVLALWLVRLGIRIRIVDKTAEPGTTSRALAVQARTLEFYRQMGLADAVVERGRKMVAANLWVAGQNLAHVFFGDVGPDLSPFPYALVYPQDEHERLLIDRLGEAGILVERETELVGFDEANGHVAARLKRLNGESETCKTAYIAGCDGARSLVRESLRIGFPGGQYEHLFYVADVEATGTAMNGEINVGLDKSEFLAVFPLTRDGHARLVGTIRREAEGKIETLSWSDVSKRVIEWMSIDVRCVNWFSTYRVHHRVAEHFRKGRAFLLGDAAHIHSPVGGQGMNTGIGDAVNLSWKLAAALKGRADASLLDSYEPERIAFAKRLVATTDQAFVAVTSSSAKARFLRLKLAPLLLPLFSRFRTVRRGMFRTVSQTAVHYRNSSISQGQAGKVHSGDRLPWVKTEVNRSASDNFAPLTSFDWQVHVYGEAGEETRSACTARNLPLWVFPWSAGMRRAGLRRGALYLVRPDGYVAMANAGGSAAALTSYLDERRLSPIR